MTRREQSRLAGWSLAALLALASAAGASTDVDQQRRILLDRMADANTRLSAALELCGEDLPFLNTQLMESADPTLQQVVLRAVEIRSGGVGVADLAPAVLALAMDAANAEVADQAKKALAAMIEAERRPGRGRVQALLVEALKTEALGAAEADSRVATLCSILGEARQLDAVEPLISVLERAPAGSEAARAAGTALQTILRVSPGDDPAAWRAHWIEVAGKSRDQILEELLDRERAERQNEARAAAEAITARTAELKAKDDIIVRLKSASDLNNLAALLEDLTFEIPGVRRFAAETLSRRDDEWDISPAREVVLSRLEHGEPPEVAAAFLQLLDAIEVKAKSTGPDPRRDALVAAALKSGEGAVVAAAALVSEHLESPPITEALRAAVSVPQALPKAPEARAALLKAAGALQIEQARDALIFALRHDESPDVRTAAANALGALRLADTRDDLAYVLQNDTDWRVRRRAAAALPEVAGPAAVESLVAGLHDSRPEVRIDVINALVEVGRKHADALARVEGALIDRLAWEQDVQPALVKALGTLASRSGAAAIARVSSGGAANGNGNGAEDAVWREARAAFQAIAKAAQDPVEFWREITTLLEPRPDRAAWAAGQRLRTLEEAGAPLRARVEATLDQALLLLRAQDVEKALQLLAQPLPADADRDLRARLAWVRAQALLQAARPLDAGSALQEALSLDALPADERDAALRASAAIQLSLEKPEAAIAALRKVEQPTTADVLLLARLMRKSGKPAEAAERLKKLETAATVTDPIQRVELAVELAEALLDLGDRAGALAQLEALEPPPETPEQLLQRIEAALQRAQAERSEIPKPQPPSPEGPAGGPPAEQAPPAPGPDHSNGGGGKR